MAGTLWVHNSGVYTSVVVVDPKDRMWEIKWGQYAEEIRGSTMTPAQDADYTGSLVSTAQALGDTDDGTQRTAQIRPQGQVAWCELKMRVSSLW